ncbi:hypothetical protein ACFLZN_00385 [Nanoarchaeota archaeon]
MNQGKVMEVLDLAISPGDYIYIHYAPGYFYVPVIACSILEKKETIEDFKGIPGEAFKPYKGNGLVLSKSEHKSKNHKVITSNILDKLLHESSIELFVFVGEVKEEVLKKLDKYPLFNTKVLFLNFQKSNIKKVFSPQIINKDDNFKTGWIKTEDPDFVLYSYKFFEMCGTPPTQEDMYKERRKKRYPSTF